VVREGRALIYIPDPGSSGRGSGFDPSWLPVFYNPVMEFNRDVSVAALQAYLDLLAPRRPIIAVEPLTATGVRPVRYSLEVDGIEAVYAGDIDEASARLAKANASINGVEDKVFVSRSDARELMYRLKKERIPILFADIDPFGTPAPFVEAAVSIVGRGGLLAVTATDLAVLEGSKPRTARRRYGVRVHRIPQSKEVAVRVLLAFIAQRAAMLDKSIRPLLSYYADHYVRVYVVVDRGAGRADRMLEEDIGCIVYDEGTGVAALERGQCDDPGSIQPVWVSNIFDREFTLKCLQLLAEKYTYLGTYKRSLKLLERASEEALLGGHVHQRIDAIASKARVNTPPVNMVVEGLRRGGFTASRTIFSPSGVRTDADKGALLDLIVKGQVEAG